MELDNNDGNKEIELTNEEYRILGRIFGSFAQRKIKELKRPKRETDFEYKDEEKSFKRGGVLSFGRRKGNKACV